MDVSIAIVSYNTKDFLERCLKSTFKYTKNIKFEVIVVDNASSDKSAELVIKKFPHVKLIKNKKNNYFSKANNQALRAARGRYFLLLAPDAYFIDNSVKKFVDYMDKNKKIGAVDGLELSEDKKIVITGFRFSTPLLDFYELSFIGKRIADKKALNKFRIKNRSRKDEFPIDVGCDAFLCIRTDLMKRIKGYDEKFLLFYTENDLCLRIKNEGYEIMHYPKAILIHKFSVSTKKMGWEKFDIYYKDLLNYYLKNGYKISGLFLYVLLTIEKYLLKIFRPNTIVYENKSA